ncbi:uncharacterized protein LOC121371988 [Gigantopelta aegis]|uniref:uncharacterized protein LOC121371988 n=1 Tax=Gigantopelta aegis TaxID=1735272 RepID=UPI001B88B8F4|nr:uncharacterized protein LOC121371988 [Gigantopelta aegis]
MWITKDLCFLKMSSTTVFLTVMYQMCRMSWRRACCLFSLLTCFFLLMLVAFLGLKIPSAQWYHFPAACRTPDSILKDMKVLVFKINEALSELQISHAICYGTLWGTLRNGELLPWDNNVDFCVNWADINKVDSDHITEIFNQKQLSISYVPRLGHYEVKYGSADGYVTVFSGMFYGEMYRTGWLYNLLWWFQSKPISFPTNLLEAPLPTKKLYGHDVPVPKESIEILKYLYPDDWWLEVRPPGCH